MASRFAILRVFTDEILNEDISNDVIVDELNNLNLVAIARIENIYYDCIDIKIGGSILPRTVPGAPLRVYRIKELRELKVKQ